MSKHCGGCWGAGYRLSAMPQRVLVSVRAFLVNLTAFVQGLRACVLHDDYFFQGAHTAYSSWGYGLSFSNYPPLYAGVWRQLVLPDELGEGSVIGLVHILEGRFMVSVSCLEVVCCTSEVLCRFAVVGY